MSVAAFKILAYIDRVPTMAVCTRCEQKFFAPRLIFRSDRVGAEEYSRDKFVQHKMSQGCGGGVVPTVHRRNIPNSDNQSEDMMTTSQSIKNEVHQLIQFQIETFRRPVPLTSSDLFDYHRRSEKIKTLYQELDLRAARMVLERRMAHASTPHQVVGCGR
jgi:hypothetical protein